MSNNEKNPLINFQFISYEICIDKNGCNVEKELYKVESFKNIEEAEKFANSSWAGNIYKEPYSINKYFDPILENWRKIETYTKKVEADILEYTEKLNYKKQISGIMNTFNISESAALSMMMSRNTFLDRNYPGLV